MDFEVQPTGHEVIDHLRIIQIVSRDITDPLEKTRFVSEAIVNAQSQLEDGLYMQPLEVESATVIGAIRENYRTRRFKFLDPLRFSGLPVACNYLVSAAERASCVAVSFVFPHIVKPDEMGDDYRLFTFEVPVLEIGEVEEAA